MQIRKLNLYSMQKGVSLFEVLIVIFMIGIIGIIVYTNIAGSTATANEASAISSLKTIVNAQQNCLNVQISDVKRYCSQSELVSKNLLDKSFSESPTQKNGFVFSVKPTGSSNEFFDAFAVPSQSGKSGNRAFTVNEKGTIYASEKGIYTAPSINPSTRAISGGNPIN